MVNHHFSPPFGRICSNELFQASQANSKNTSVENDLNNDG